MSIEQSAEGKVSTQYSSTLRTLIESTLSEMRSHDGEEVFNFILRDAPIGAVLVDRRTGFKLANAALCQMLGYTESELQGKSFADILHPEDYEKSVVLAYLLTQGQVCHFKKRFVGKSGAPLWVSLTIKLIREATGLPLYGIGLIQPLTTTDANELHPNRQKSLGISSESSGDRLGLRSTEFLPPAIGLLQAFNSLPVVVAISTLPEQRYVYVSDGLLRFFGHHRDKVIGRTERDLGFFGQAFKGGDPVPSLTSTSVLRDQDAQFTVRAAPKQERHGALAIRIVPTETEKYLVTAFVDLTEHKRKEAVIRASEARYQAIVEKGTEGILLVDPLRKKILEATRPFLQLVGYSREETDGFTLYDLMVQDRELVDRDVSNLAVDQLHSIGDRQFRRKDGSAVDLEISADVGYYGAVLAVRLVLRDVGERRRLEEQLHQAVKMEALGRFAGGIAHDFNNLLVSVLGYSSLLASKLRHDEVLSRMARDINDVALRARALTGQLLSFSRSQTLPAEILDLNVVVQGMDTLLRRIIGEDIKLTCVLEAVAARVRANPSQIEQAILNLAANSRDAMPNGGFLQIRTSNFRADLVLGSKPQNLAPGDYVALSVTDSGCGIDPAILPRIFEPFFTTKGLAAGTGLGLSTVYGVVKQAGGEIMVTSELGKGATFEIYLPHIQDQGSLFEGTAEERPLAPASPTVLLIEDEETVRSLVCDILKEQGYQVLSAATPLRGLELAQEYGGPIHLCVTDVIMPEMLGPELVTQLLKIRPQTKILYISGYSSSEIIRRTGLERAGSILQKPFTPDELHRKVREVLNPDTAAHNQLPESSR